MTIATKTGDDGSTALMYGRRVSKTDPRVEAYGTVDELNAAIGLARSGTLDQRSAGWLLAIQKELVIVMGELAVAASDRARYAQGGYQFVTAAMVSQLDEWVAVVEQEAPPFSGWATPGATPAAAALDFARTICRRAERRVVGLAERADLENAALLPYLNRLADLLWLLARRAELPSSDEEPQG